MDHSYFQDRVSAFLDNSLPPYEQEVVARHIEDCEACQSLANQLAEVDKLVEKHSGLREDDYWESLARKIETRILSSTKDSQTVSRAGIITRLFGQPGVMWKATALAASVALITFIALHEKDITRDVELFDDGNRLQKLVPVVDSTGDIKLPELPGDIERKLDFREVDIVGDDFTADKRSSIKKSPPKKEPDLPKQVATIDTEIARTSDVKVSPQSDQLAPTESVDETVRIIPDETILPFPEPIKEEKEQTETKALTPGLRRERLLKSIAVPSRSRETLQKLSAAENVKQERKLRDGEPTDAEDEVTAEFFTREREPDSATQELLTYWRERKNELERPITQTAYPRSGLKSLAVEDEGLLRHRRDSILLVCNYNIARLSSDSAEFKASVKYIVDHFETDLRWLAEQFLDSLGENK